MKKLDKLILSSFFGPFFLTFFITVFILLLQFMLKYFDDIIGKGLEFQVLVEFLFYFSIRITPDALPLAVLLSSLMTFGNLGEHFELTAIKSAGISLVRAIRPIFIFSVLLSIGAFFSNNYIVPAANLKALSLLYDIKQKKPSMDLKEGQFYDGIPDYSIKITEKLPDGETLRDVIIYDHTKGVGNNRVIYADSSKMYTFMNEQYLVFELFDGNLYEENANSGTRSYGANQINQFTRNDFDEMKIVFSLESFAMERTREDLFAGDYRMKNIEELQYDIDSMGRKIDRTMFNLYKTVPGLYSFYGENSFGLPEKYVPFQIEFDEAKKKRLDSLENIDAEDDRSERGGIKTSGINPEIVRSSFFPFELFESDSTADTVVANKLKLQNAQPEDTTWQALVAFVAPKLEAELSDPRKINNYHDNAVRSARNVKATLASNNVRVQTLQREINKNAIEMYRKYAQAAACFSMFLIGAPLGAIIKKGGLGIPVIVSIFFYILYYVLNILSIKWAREDIVTPIYAAWISNLVLLPIGLFFLKQARKDARLFDADFYNVVVDKIKSRFNKNKDA